MITRVVSVIQDMNDICKSYRNKTTYVRECYTIYE